MMLTIMPRRQEDVERKAVAKVTATSSGGDDTVKQAPVRKGKKVGPNDHVLAEAVKSIRNAAALRAKSITINSK